MMKAIKKRRCKNDWPSASKTIFHSSHHLAKENLPRFFIPILYTKFKKKYRRFRPCKTEQNYKTEQTERQVGHIDVEMQVANHPILSTVTTERILKINIDVHGAHAKIRLELRKS